MTKRILSLVLALTALFSAFGTFNAFATDSDADNDPGDMRYTYVDNYSGSIKLSGITASCSASLSARTSTSLKIKMELQKYYTSGYETVKTWTESKTGKSLSASGSKLINPLSSYRLKITYTAGSESVTVYKHP